MCLLDTLVSFPVACMDVDSPDSMPVFSAMASDSWLLGTVLNGNEFYSNNTRLGKKTAYMKWVHSEETRCVCIGKKSVASGYFRFAAMGQI